VSAHKPATESVLSDLQVLRVLQERLERHVQNLLQAPQINLDLAGWAEAQLKRLGLEDRSIPQKLRELLERLEARVQQGQPAQLEQLLNVSELTVMVPLARTAFRVWSSREALALLRRLEQLAENLGVEIPEISRPDYETDFAVWAEHQVLMIQGGMWEELDQEHLVEELEALSRSEHSELESRLEILITHLLKWQFDAASQNPRRLWRATIREQRHRLTRLFQRSPSLRPTLSVVLNQNYPHARLMALDETDVPASILPETCPWTLQQILDDHFLPEVMP
jgi:Domain of unknown function DUF29